MPAGIVARAAALTVSAVVLQWFLTAHTGYRLDVSWENVQRVLFRDKSDADLIEQVSMHSEKRLSTQPDDYDAAADTNIEMMADRCGEAVLPQSTFTTNCVEISARSRYMGRHRDGQHRWKYSVEFHNHGADTVQMLARHWIFTSAEGHTEEVKGPGARGDMPVLAPGQKWSYESGAALETPAGSMRGSFQMEVLRFGQLGCSAAPATFFSARVARLALGGFEEQPLNVPCGDIVPRHLWSTTSVRSTKRVIIGTTTEYIKSASKPLARKYIFSLDVQINNARTTPVTITAHEWKIFSLGAMFGGDSGGDDGGQAPSARRVDVEEVAGPGLGGFAKIGDTTIQPGQAFRYHSFFQIETGRALVNGSYTVETDAGPVQVPVGGIAFSDDGTPLDPQLHL